MKLSYTHSSTSDYELSGAILGQGVSLRFPKSDSDFASIELKSEVSRLFATKGGALVAPYVELGGEFEFVRPDGGQILSRTLALEDTSPCTFTVRAGMRALLFRSVAVEAAFGYLSLGQSDLDIKEGMLRISFGF